MRLLLSVLCLFTISTVILNSQGRVSGDFQFEGQYYQEDESIGTDDVPENFGNQGYLNVIYNISNFEFGLRYEAYRPSLLGIDPRYDGSGFPYLYGKYRSDFIDVTAGSFYEQFGSGLILRAYEEKALGVDNAINGMRVNLKPDDGIELTGLVGTMREFWTQSDGILRGMKGSIFVDNYLDIFGTDAFELSGGFVSKYQADRESFYNLPENVFSFYSRGSYISSSFSLDAEYSYKINDPSSVNNYSFSEGEGFIFSGSYFEEGFSMSFDFHRADNMDFRAERSAVGNVLNINFIPPLTKQHTYSLTSLYPFATQLVGEIGVQGEMTYKFENGSLLGGEYGTTVVLNYSRVHNIDSTALDEFEYNTDFFAFGDRLFFEDMNFEISKRWTSDFKTIVSYLNQTYDKDVAENGWSPAVGKVYSDIVVLDMTYRFSDDYAIRADLEHIWATEDSTLKTPDYVNGNWIMALFELTISPNYFISISDSYNYGNEFDENQIHYYMGSFAYVTGGTRVQLSYGRQRAGIICVGGVCRAVPASSGAYLSVSTSF